MFLATREQACERAGQLYDLDADPSEQDNLYNQKPEVVKLLTARMRAAIVSEATAGDGAEGVTGASPVA